MIISVSILSSEIKAEDIVKKLDNTKADFIHVDIMDGKFVDNKSWTFTIRCSFNGRKTKKIYR